jgi:hypothetical protein
MVGVLKFLDINIICYSILYCEAMKPASVPQKEVRLASKQAAEVFEVKVLTENCF